MKLLSDFCLPFIVTLALALCVSCDPGKVGSNQGRPPTVSVANGDKTNRFKPKENAFDEVSIAIISGTNPVKTDVLVEKTLRNAGISSHTRGSLTHTVTVSITNAEKAIQILKSAQDLRGHPIKIHE